MIFDSSFPISLAVSFVAAQGTISGTLIVTPNVLMFDPSASEPAVRELGLEPLGLTVPLLDIERVKVYNSDAALRLRFPGSSPPQTLTQTQPPPLPSQLPTAPTTAIQAQPHKSGAEGPSATTATSAQSPPFPVSSSTTELAAEAEPEKSEDGAGALSPSSSSPVQAVVTEQPQSTMTVASPTSMAPLVIIGAADVEEAAAAEAAGKIEAAGIADASKAADAKQQQQQQSQPQRPRTPQPVQVQLVNAVSLKDRADLFQPIEGVSPSLSVSVSVFNVCTS